jgi:hypothetical protein
LDPFDLIVSRLDGVRGHRPKVMARCPAHEDRSPSLSIRETSDGTCLVRDFGGCENADVLGAIGLHLADLFRPRADRGTSRWGGFDHLLATAPPAVVNDAIAREITLRQARECERLGFEPPLASRVINAARAAVGRRFSRALPPVAPFLWERCFPHCEDPLWPLVFDRALEEEVRGRWHFLYPDAAPADTDPHGHDEFDLIRAEARAARNLRQIAGAK